jgi:hypothetical protein
LPDVLPIVLNRTYRPGDMLSRAFGVGTNHNYDFFLVGNPAGYTEMDLILPDGGRVHYVRISSGGSFGDAVLENQSGASPFYKSQIR